MVRISLAFALAGLAVALLSGCPGQEVQEEAPGRTRPLPSYYVPALERHTRARKIEEESGLVGGPGAEGQAGDLVLENSLARFVVAAADHRYPHAGGGGNVLDAAVQRGPDCMRLLLPRLGPFLRGRPVYEKVEIASAGGKDVPASVRASGHWDLDQKVRVTTTYRLRPESTSLLIRTRVTNRSSRTLEDFALADEVYHGRTARYVPGAGLYPRGGPAQTDWFSFFRGSSAWGLFNAERRRLNAFHRPGCSELTYRTVSMEPSQVRSYSRELVATAGGPEGVADAAWAGMQGRDSDLTCRITDRRTGRPLQGALAEVRRPGGGSVCLLVSGADGTASARLPAGRYLLACWAQSRPPALLPVPLREGQERVMKVELAREARLEARVRSRTKPAGADGANGRPSAGRIVLWPDRQMEGWPGFRAPFHASPCGCAVAVGPSGSGDFALLPLSPGTPATYLLVAARGPLYGYAARGVEAAAGEVARAEFTVNQVIDPGDYVGVDFRQYAGACPDCPLTDRERAVTNRAEALEGAVLCRPWGRADTDRDADHAGPTELPAVELISPSCGAFSVIPAGGEQDGEGETTEFPPARSSPEELFAFVRERYPDALIQANYPLSPRSGYLRLTGQGPEGADEERPEFSDGFNALELLSGRNVSAAKAVLPAWFRLLNRGKKFFVTGGSGTRGLPWPEAGVARTYVHCPHEGPYPPAEKLREAVLGLRREPNAFVTNGPFLRVTVNGRPIGSRQAVSGPVEMRLRVLAPSWVDVNRARVYRNGEVLREIEVPSTGEPLRLDRTIEVEVESDCWLVVVAEGDVGMRPVYPGRGLNAVLPFAATNPFWLDADGDGELSIDK